MHRIVVSVFSAIVLLFAAAACGSDGSGDAQAFCETVGALDAQDEGAEDSIPDVEELDELAANAPDEISDEVELLVEGFKQAAELEESDDPDEAFAVIFGLMLDPEFIAAMEDLEDYMIEECGMDPEDVDVAMDDDAEDENAEDDDADPFDEDEESTVMGVLTGEVEDRYDELLDEAGLTSGGFGWGQLGSDGQIWITIQLDGDDVDDHIDAIVEVCEGMSSLLAEHPDAEGTGMVEIDTAEDYEVVVTNEDIEPGDAGSCETV